MVLVIVVVVIDVSFVLTLVEMSSLVLVIAFLLLRLYFSVEKNGQFAWVARENFRNFSQFHHHQIDFEKLLHGTKRQRRGSLILNSMLMWTYLHSPGTVLDIQK